MSRNTASRAMESEIKKIKAQTEVLTESLRQLELEEAKQAAVNIKASTFKIIKLASVEALNIIQDVVESIYKGSTIVLIKEENFEDALKRLKSSDCEFVELNQIDYKTAVQNLRLYQDENAAKLREGEEKANAVEVFDFDQWKEEVSAILESPVGAANAQLKAKIDEFYQLVRTVTGIALVWTRDDSDAVFFQSAKAKRRLIVNLAFKSMLPLLNIYLTDLKLGHERVDHILLLLSRVLLE